MKGVQSAKGFAALLEGAPVFINIGVRDFADSLREQGYEVVHVDWSPPAGGDLELAAVLDELM